LISAADRLRAHIKERRPPIGDAPPSLPGSEWRPAGDGGWYLWDRLADDGLTKRWRYFDRLTEAEWKAIKNRHIAEVGSDDLDSRSSSDIDMVGPDVSQVDHVVATVRSKAGSLVTHPENSPVATSDSGVKKPARKTKKVTSDSKGVKPQGKVVLPFHKKAISHTKRKEKDQWEIKPCGCRLPKFPKHEWRDFENGHRLLAVIGYGKSKNDKRVKKRDCVRYYTHAAMKLFWENEYEVQSYNSTKA